MNEYIELISRLRKQKDKIKSLPDLIFKVSFNRHRIPMLRAVVRLLEENEGIENLEWFDNPEQKKVSKVKGRKIVGQFRYRLTSPDRVLTVSKKL